VFSRHAPDCETLLTLTADPPVRPRAAPPPASRPPRLRWGRLLLAVLVLAVVVFLILFRWDWLRGPLARYLSGRLHRPVAITGHLQVHPWSWTPQATVTGLVIGNAPWAGPRPMAQLPRLTVQARILPLIFRGKLILPLVEADRPDVVLFRDLQGRANWDTPRMGPPHPLKLPAIDHLVIRDGHLSYVDEKRRLRFAGRVSSSEEAVSSGRGVFVMSGTGTLNTEPFEAFVRGGALIHVDPSRPYAFVARMQAGATRLRLDGHIDHPFDFGALAGVFSLSGPDLADVYRVTGIALPNSPPYSLAAGFARRGSVFALRNIRGKVGGSDLEGAFTVDDSRGRPMVTADLASRRLRLADFVAIIGGAPAHAAPGELSPMEKLAHARMRAEHRLLPDARLAVDRIRGMDARVVYRAQNVDAGRFPIGDFAVHADLDHSLLTIDPLSLTVSQGRLAGMIRIDARRPVQQNAIDLRLTGMQLGPIVKANGPNPTLDGTLWARARLSGAGASVREAAAHADGSVSAVIPGGQIRKTLAAMLGIDLDRTAFLLVTRNKTDTPIRCAVADFEARDGVLQASQVIFDTSVVQVQGSGEVDLRDETLNLRLQGRPKKISIIRLNAPITLTGRLDAPKLGVDVVKAAPQAAGAVALGIFAAPLAAVLPFIAPGLAKNADCAALETQARAATAAPPPSARH
jgi:uncharacterized protein involved in outer membrane biogenesis